MRKMQIVVRRRSLFIKTFETTLLLGDTSKCNDFFQEFVILNKNRITFPSQRTIYIIHKFQYTYYITWRNAAYIFSCIFSSSVKGTVQYIECDNMTSRMSTSHFMSAFAARSSLLRMRHSTNSRMEWTSKLFRKKTSSTSEGSK